MITEKITSGQRKTLLRLLEDAVDTSGLTKDQTTEILKVGNLVQADLKVSFGKYSIADKRFGPAIREFEFTVPSDYNHDTQLDTFAEKTKSLETTYYFNDDLTSANFAKATNKLVPGKTYKVKMFPVLERVTSEDCIDFLAKQGALLVGGQGVTLLQDNKADEFPVGKWVVSFDQKDALWIDSDGYHGVPGVGRRSDGDFGFDLGGFGRDWYDDDVILCFCDVPVDKQA